MRAGLAALGLLGCRPDDYVPGPPSEPTIAPAVDPAPAASDPSSPPAPDPIEEEEPAVGFPPVEAFDEPGPFAAAVDDLVDADCTVHLPLPLGEDGLLHPIVLWGNGTATTPAFYTGLLSHLATHGFVVAAANTSNAGDGSEMLACLDALLLASEDPTSGYHLALDPGRVGASGHSQGAAGALMAALDPRVGATAPMEPFILYVPFGGDFDLGAIGLQEAPMFLISGGLDSIAVPAIHQQAIFDGTPAPITWALDLDATHFEPLGDGGDFRGPLTAWLRARLMDDPSAMEVVDGPDCALCADPGWVVAAR